MGTDLRRGKVLVTGADGFIGSHLVEALVARAIDVRALVQYNSFGQAGWLDSLPPQTRAAIEVVAGDVRDQRSVTTAMRGCSTVFHLAALIAIPYSYLAPQSYIDTNVGGTLAMLEAARDLGIERFLQTSTSEVYGTAQFVPISETHPLNAQSPYAASKIGADQLALSYHRAFGLPVTVVRPFNTYGPRQSARAVIPTVALQIAHGTRVVRLGSLHPTRDFSFVSDTAAGFIALAEAGTVLGEVVNLGSGFEISIGDTVHLIAEVMSTAVTIETDSKRLRPEASEVERLFADTAKVQRLTGWRPDHGGREGFKRGLAQTVAWFSDPANLRRYGGEYQV